MQHYDFEKVAGLMDTLSRILDAVYGLEGEADDGEDYQGALVVKAGGVVMPGGTFELSVPVVLELLYALQVTTGARLEGLGMERE